MCVTPLEIIDKALAIAARPGVIFCSFGDMLRVPGTARDLFRVKSAGGDVRVVYSPLDALTLARREPGPEVVFFGIGFETTAPPNAMAVYQAKRLGLTNFTLLVSHVLVPPAIDGDPAVAGLPGAGFLAAGPRVQRDGHVGVPAARASAYRVPIVVTGFEPLDLLEGIRRTVRQLEAGRPRSRTRTPRAVQPEGNPAAGACCEEVFEVTDRTWRGIGDDPGERLAAARGTATTTPSALRGRRHPDRGVGRCAAAARCCRG